MIEVMGHRGGRELWPENSLQGFRAAIALGVDTVELDVHPSTDGELMVIHDPTLERTTEGTGPVSRRTAAELRATPLRDAGGEGVPTLDAVLALIAASSAGVYVEIKTDMTANPYPGLEARLLDALERHRLVERAGIVCFVPEILETVRRIRPGMRVLAPVFRQTAQMLGGLEATLDRLEQIEGCLVSVERSMLTHAQALCMARLGPRRLCVGVTNDSDDLAYWFTQPVRQVCSDRPDLALAARRAAGLRQAS